MFFKLLTIFFSSLLFQSLQSSSKTLNFIYDGFPQRSYISIQGIAAVTPNGLLRLTNTTVQQTGHAFYNKPIRLKNSPNGTVSSFSTTFVFAIHPRIPGLSGHGIAFVIAPNTRLPYATPSQYMGLFNITSNGNKTNHVFAIELDTIRSTEFNDINDNHVGIDINSLTSVKSSPAGWWDKKGQFNNITLIGSKPMQVWIDYNGRTHKINVMMGPLNEEKPKKPLVSIVRDLSFVILQDMFVGFSSATGTVPAEHYVLGWSFGVNREAPPLDLSKLPKLPLLHPTRISYFCRFGIPSISIILIFSSIFLVCFIARRRRMFEEELDDWETELGKNRLRFKDLYYATKGFKEKDLLGSGGFGRVYKGVMLETNLEIAVKKVSHDSRQGLKEFVSEIVSIGRMSHPNLVPLLGYCRRRGELLLVYEYMPNGSLDKYLYNTPEVTLDWKQRSKVILDVASGLFYLHEDWEQVVIHRDVKASNVLLDDHGADPQTTNVVGTLGYLAPEHTRTGRATTATDVFAFGAFLLEVVCGRRPIEIQHESDEVFLLVDWVFRLWNRGNILDAVDPNIGSEYNEKEVEMILKIGLLCSHSDPRARPSMRQVLHYLRGDAKLSDLSPLDLSKSGMMFGVQDGFSEPRMLYASSVCKRYTSGSSIADSLLSGGR
ncbi:hypothetical protein F2Q69_00022828 [Brassica cretica]|uniref:non-specific serine/threonine protein kinase n=1 Tax=Brassica cretica TaxID=69181 RepID=A0A8S9QLK2_BRACR|nr:hypothetical protein F2Q69_00022828 [Brassica cretica]